MQRHEALSRQFGIVSLIFSAPGVAFPRLRPSADAEPADLQGAEDEKAVHPVQRSVVMARIGALSMTSEMVWKQLEFDERLQSRWRWIGRDACLHEPKEPPGGSLGGFFRRGELSANPAPEVTFYVIECAVARRHLNAAEGWTEEFKSGANS